MTDRGLAIGYYLTMLRASYPQFASSPPDHFIARVRDFRENEAEFWRGINAGNRDADDWIEQD